MIPYIVNEYNNIHYFNYPIEFHEQELYYYKLYILIIIELYNNRKKDEDYFAERSKVAEFVLKNNIFNNKYIINNEDKMNILIILILYDKLDEKGESINFNRLLQTNNITIFDLKKFLIEKKIGEVREIKNPPTNVIYFNQTDKYITINDPNDFCLQNLIDKDLQDNNNKYLLYNINSLLKENSLTHYFKRIHTFLINFIKSNVYSQAITVLFPNYSQNLLMIF